MKELCGASLHTAQIFYWNKDGAVRFVVEWGEDEVVLNGIELL